MSEEQSEQVPPESKEPSLKDQITDILDRSDAKFLSLYEEGAGLDLLEGLAILLAHANFNRNVANNLVPGAKEKLPIDAANRILGDQSDFEKYIIEEQKFLNYYISELAKARENERIARIDGNTRLKSTLIVSVTVGTVFCVLSPFVTTLLQPAADKLCKPAKQEEKAPPAPVMQFNNTTNYYGPVTINDNCPHNAQPEQPKKSAAKPSKKAMKRHP
ncbi:MAG: hypothetical protein PHD48_11785 [Alphaproteobacteria bacterium]|nr:hypothetical protein [Alphaproteobacteria bacterium]